MDGLSIIELPEHYRIDGEKLDHQAICIFIEQFCCSPDTNRMRGVLVSVETGFYRCLLCIGVYTALHTEESLEYPNS
ncbi:hypothetical protein P3T76_004952 [Phytophthora citrophthora]|uniref:Uncharacterized protein n=1 Tax=Phytophthora citrophthora TaxID=4793 RepID=A0AAD9GS82_9STRA|nr:hypothetical protein P3T76_004952 [Phytophthora citrophthora]